MAAISTPHRADLSGSWAAVHRCLKRVDRLRPRPGQRPGLACRWGVEEASARCVSCFRVRILEITCCQTNWRLDVEDGERAVGRRPVRPNGHGGSPSRIPTRASPPRPTGLDADTNRQSVGVGQMMKCPHLSWLAAEGCVPQYRLDYFHRRKRPSVSHTRRNVRGF